ncbi:type VII secretion integral membrane protein EccD [Micromonospora sp. WMMA1949]|uniref:type VII secretion integral membrane protein EccD n=1 Tax=Micromonospora sp. WMMA1949 TaxID=3015162 RepID=UPI0022B70CE6|nr:type VII secretion integral membrane protein EccD [Micromonospora sp. WMMA1949]MCZ7426839.1 type VII secretion integral membrane protein EccD [Micromonospora sp. WMMA1949]
MTSGLARVTISAPRRRVDVALPEQVPLAELLPEVLRHAGEGLADDGERHGGWVLRRTDGAVLATAQALLPQGVRDGEVLHLVPARAQWPELEYDDVVEAIVDGARRRGAAWSGQATRAAALAGAAVPLAVGLVAVVAAGPGARGWPVAAAVALILVLAATAASRAYGDGPVGATLGGYALPWAAVAGALAVASGDPVGPIPGLRWVGAPELLVGSVALLLVAVLGLLGVASRSRVFVAGVTVGLAGVTAALGGLVLDPDGTAAVLLAVLVFALGGLPLLAIRVGKLPLPPLTLPSPAGTRDLPDRGRVHAAVARAEEVLTGMLLGHAVLAVGAVAVLVCIGRTAGLLLAAVAGGVLLLRSRLFVAVRHRVPAIVAGLAAFALLGVVLAERAGPGARLALTVGGLALALTAVTAGATYARRPVSPYLGRLADLTDTALVIAVVPVACAVLDLYDRARDLLA